MNPVRGDIYWLTTGSDTGAEIPHPWVIIEFQAKPGRKSDVARMVMLTTNRKKLSWPGNVVIPVGEAGLPRLSIADGSTESMVNLSLLGGYIGRLAPERVLQIQRGIATVRSMFEYSSYARSKSGLKRR